MVSVALVAAAAIRGVMVVVALDRKHGDPFCDGFGGDMVAHEFLDTCHIDYDWWKRFLMFLLVSFPSSVVR